MPTPILTALLSKLAIAGLATATATTGVLVATDSLPDLARQATEGAAETVQVEQPAEDGGDDTGSQPDGDVEDFQEADREAQEALEEAEAKAEEALAEAEAEDESAATPDDEGKSVSADVQTVIDGTPPEDRDGGDFGAAVAEAASQNSQDDERPEEADGKPEDVRQDGERPEEADGKPENVRQDGDRPDDEDDSAEDESVEEIEDEEESEEDEGDDEGDRAEQADGNPDDVRQDGDRRP